MVFTDLRLPDGDGINFFESSKKKIFPNLPVVVMTSYAEVSTAVEAMKLGAFDYISKPFQQEDVLNVIKNAQSSTRTAQQDVSVAKKTTTSSAADNSAPAKVTKAP